MKLFIVDKNIFSSSFMIWKMEQQCVVNDTDFKCLEIKTTLGSGHPSQPKTAETLK